MYAFVTYSISNRNFMRYRNLTILQVLGSFQGEVDVRIDELYGAADNRLLIRLLPVADLLCF